MSEERYEDGGAWSNGAPLMSVQNVSTTSSYTVHTFTLPQGAPILFFPEETRSPDCVTEPPHLSHIWKAAPILFFPPHLPHHSHSHTSRRAPPSCSSPRGRAARTA